MKALGTFLNASEKERTEKLLEGYVIQTERLSKEGSLFAYPFLADLFVKAGVTKLEGATIIIRGSGIAALFFAMGSLSPLFLILAFCAAWLTFNQFTRKAFLRAESFERDYTALLLSLASAVKTGIDPVVALSSSYSLFSEKSEVRIQGELFKANIASGRSETESIAEFGKTIPHPDLPLFRAAFLLARREGSSLAECLHRLARVTRQRQSFRRKVKAAIAMQKLSAFAIAACCVVITCIQFCANPAAFYRTMQHPQGAKIMLVGVLLVASGVAWMLRIAKSRI